MMNVLQTHVKMEEDALLETLEAIHVIVQMDIPEIIVQQVRIRFYLNIFYFISHKKRLGRAKMLCHSPLPHNGCTCIEIIIYSHSTFTHTCT